MLKQKIKNRESGILLYGITPPKKMYDDIRIHEIAAKQIERISSLDIDGLILYDIQDEKDRIDTDRPFPYLPTLDPYIYSRQYLQELNIPKITYKFAGKYTPDEMQAWLTETKTSDSYAVFVGIAADHQQVKITLPQAYTMKQQINPHMVLGAITIPERHDLLKDEHQRVISKIQSGCEFFVSQAVYNVQAAKNFLSDYYYHAQKHELNLAPVIITVTPCGSQKTLQFMEWLGISIPTWLKNDLLQSGDILQKSIAACRYIANDLLAYASDKNIPIGFNVESVSIRKEEIEASIELTKEIGKMMGR